MKKNTDQAGAVLLPEKIIEREVEKFSYTLKKAADIKAGCLKIDVKDLKDRVNIALATETRRQVKEWRLGVDKKRRALNADALQQIRNTNAAAKTLRELFLEGELHLKNVELKVRKWKDEKRDAKEAEKMARLQTRIDQLAPYNVVPELAELKKMSDAEFNKLLAQIQADFAAAEELKKQQAQQFFEDQKKLQQENEILKGQLEQQNSSSGSAARISNRASRAALYARGYAYR
jgi:hypothetical protein